jgi:hypothetical protein
MILPRRTRRRRTLVSRFAARGAVSLALTRSIAFAQGTDELGRYGDERARDIESRQSWALELRAGPYPPSIDEEFRDQTPYRDIFGDQAPLLFGVEFDAQLLRIPRFGSLGPGFGWGYASISAKTLRHVGSGRADQETSLSLMPMYAVGVLRIDVLAREAHVPLVPYGKAGVGYALWWVSDGEETAEEDGVIGRGRSYGGQYALGMMLLLDELDEESARHIDNTSGVNNSYIFAERYVSYLDGFGSGNQMHVGTASWFFGLALEL